MSRKQKTRKTASLPRKKRRTLAVFLSIPAFAIVLLLAFRSGLLQWGPDVPDPNRSGMEPQVAAKIAEAREAALAAPESPEAWGHFAMVLHAHGLAGEAAACYRRASEISPAEFRWQYLLSHALRNADAGAALTAAEAASRLNPAYAPAYVLRAQLLETSNRRDQALEQYRKAVELESESAMAEFGLGRLLLASGDAKEALPHLLRARDLSGEASEVHGALAQAYQKLGDREAALRENQLALRRGESVGIVDPVHYAMRKESVSSVAVGERALEAERAGDHERAETLYRELTGLRPEDPNIRTQLGDVLFRQSKLQPAKQQYLGALAIDSGHGPAHYGLGNVLNFEGDYEGAAREYRAALAARPDHVQTLVNLAGILAFQGDLSQALSLCRQAVDLDSKSFAPNLQLAQVLMQQKAFREAIPPLRTALEARPDSGPAHRQLSIALVAIGDYPAAWKHLERALALGEEVPAPLVEELKRRASAS
jgi:tetratricopeptide (TPR) repeat protein